MPVQTRFFMNVTLAAGILTATTLDDAVWYGLKNSTFAVLIYCVSVLLVICAVTVRIACCHGARVMPL